MPPLNQSDTVMLAFEKWLARVLLLNSALALAVGFGLLGAALEPGAATLVCGAALLGLAAAVLSLRRLRLGLWGGLWYYALQVFSYFPVDGGGFSVKAGVSLGLVMHFHSGVLVLNALALALLAATGAVLAWRRRSAATL